MHRHRLKRLLRQPTCQSHVAGCWRRHFERFFFPPECSLSNQNPLWSLRTAVVQQTGKKGSHSFSHHPLTAAALTHRRSCLFHTASVRHVAPCMAARSSATITIQSECQALGRRCNITDGSLLWPFCLSPVCVVLPCDSSTDHIFNDNYINVIPKSVWRIVTFCRDITTNQSINQSIN